VLPRVGRPMGLEPKEGARWDDVWRERGDVGAGKWLTDWPICEMWREVVGERGSTLAARLELLTGMREGLTSEVEALRGSELRKDRAESVSGPTKSLRTRL
jgi:hypothetical protein